MPEEDLTKRVTELEEKLHSQQRDIAFLKSLLDLAILRTGSEVDDFIEKIIIDMDEIYFREPELRRLWVGYIDRLKKVG